MGEAQRLFLVSACALCLFAFFTLTSCQGNSTIPNNNSTTTNTTNNNTSSPPTTRNTTCSVNETSAEAGRDCLTCQQPNVACPLINETRCFCNQGYVRDTSNGNVCILAADCPTETCTGNATFSEMGSNCFTCDNYRTAACPMSDQAKCYCNDGFVLNEDDNICVRPQDCPVYQFGQCRANQTFANRGYDCDTCSNYNLTNECLVSEEQKCYCNIGYVRDTRTERCVFPRDCTQNIEEDSCAANQTLANSGYDCATCKDPNANCGPANERKCYCYNGYVRTSDGNCILAADCPTIRLPVPAGPNCGDPRSFGCNPVCVRTCKQHYYGGFCQPICRVCTCPVGEVRNENGDCISISECREYPYKFPHYSF